MRELVDEAKHERIKQLARGLGRVVACTRSAIPSLTGRIDVLESGCHCVTGPHIPTPLARRASCTGFKRARLRLTCRCVVAPRQLLSTSYIDACTRHATQQ